MPLAKCLKHCLGIEGIKCRIKSEAGHLYICNYEHMLKLFVLGVIDFHKDKKEKFVRLVRNSIIHVHLNKSILNKANRFSQLELSRKLGISQPLVSSWKNRRCIGLNELSKIFPIFEISRKELIKNIKFLKITSSCVKDRESIKFLLSLHNFVEKPFKIEVYRNKERSNKSALFSILKDIVETLKDDDIYLRSVMRRSHLSKITIQQKLRKLEIDGYLRNVKMKGLSKVYEMTKNGMLEYQELSRLYKVV